MRTPAPLLMLAAVALGGLAVAQNRETIHYQGRLKDVGAPVQGNVDLRFTLWTAANGGAAVGRAVTRTRVPVVDGVFSVQLDFDPDRFDASDVWLEVEVALGGGAFVVLPPRQPLTAAPFALRTRGITFDQGGGRLALGEAEEEVGIGTDQPRYQLHVRGARHAAGSHVAMFDNASGHPQADGVMIRIDNGLGSTNRDNNFLTFVNGGDQVVGRVEGFDVQHGDWISPPPIPNLELAVGFTPGRLPSGTLTRGTLPSAAFAPGTLPTLSCTNGAWPTVNLTGGQLPTSSFHSGTLPNLTWTTQSIAGFQVPTGVSWSAGTLPSLTFNAGTFPAGSLSGGTFPTCTLNRGTLPALQWNPGVMPTLSFDPGALPSVQGLTVTLPSQRELQDLICWAMENGTDRWLQFALAYGLVGPAGAAAQQLAMQAELACRDEGVVYGSKGADYAEWLPKVEAADRFQLGQIVGVRGGRVSLVTAGAEQVMAVSCKPIVLGNVPEDEAADGYVKVAFMGQVPVVVRGRVRAGDYIVPSGLEDGTALAVHPEDLTVEHLGRIVGRAWSDSDEEIYGLVNVVVGVGTDETGAVLRRQREALDAVRAENERLRAELEELRIERAAFAERFGAVERALAAMSPAAAEVRR